MRQGVSSLLACYPLPATALGTDPVLLLAAAAAALPPVQGPAGGEWGWPWWGLASSSHRWRLPRSLGRCWDMPDGSDPGQVGPGPTES